MVATRADRYAAAVGFLTAAVATPSIRKGTRQLWWSTTRLIRNQPLEWGEPGNIVHTDYVPRRVRWQITRPHWTRRVGTYGMPCGCSRRFTGRMAFYRWRCPIHMPEYADQEM